MKQHVVGNQPAPSPPSRYLHLWVRKWGLCRCCGRHGYQCRCHLVSHACCRELRSIKQA